MLDDLGVKSAAVRKGLEYEQLIYNILLPFFGEDNLPESSAFNSLRPDIFVYNKRKSPIRIEIKANLGADYGEKAITIDEKTKKWVGVKAELKNVRKKEFVQRLDELYLNIFEELNINEKIINSWKIPSTSFDADTLLEMIENRELGRSLEYERILTKLEKGFDPYEQVTLARNVQNHIIKYYNSLSVYYIQIKNRGFYRLGEDKYRINEKLRSVGYGNSIPRFRPSESRLELRGKTSSSGLFRPVIRFKVSGLPKSNVSLEDTEFVHSLYKALWQ